MKRLLLIFSLAILTACATTGPVTPVQQAINTGVTSYTALDQSIIAADAAVKAGVLKGNDAKNVRAAATAAKAGLDSMLAALRSANAAAAAASGATK